jgi:signal transduction histidine kinase
MRAQSLRWRLLAGAAGAIFAALAAAWLVMGYLFEAHVQRNVENALIQQGRGLISGLVRDPSGALTLPRPPGDPRFERPTSGLYWQIDSGGQVLRSRSLWDEILTAPQNAAAGDWSAGDMQGPFDQRLVFVARRVILAKDKAPTLIVLGADHAEVTAARDVFSRDLAVFLGLLWAVLSLAAWLQVRLGLQPLADVRESLDAMQASSGARLKDTDYPIEAAPLAQAINKLADARQRDLDRAKSRAADMAHALKTPLAAIAAQSRRARASGASDAADGIDRAIEAAQSVLERELVRARVAAEASGVRVDAAPVVERLLGVIARTERGGALLYDNDAESCSLPVSEAALMEMLGPLLENAARFARTRVRISGAKDQIQIDDDGPGLSEAQMIHALERGTRLDETDPGYGLGLAIAKDAAESSGGALHLTRSDLGGLRASLVWERIPSL